MCSEHDCVECVHTNGTHSIGVLAKSVGMGRQQLFHELHEKRILMSGAGMRNTPYQPCVHHFEVFQVQFPRIDGTYGEGYTTRVKTSGINYVRKRLGLPPLDFPFPVRGGKPAR